MLEQAIRNPHCHTVGRAEPTPPPPDPQHHGYCAMSNTLVLIGPIVR